MARIPFSAQEKFIMRQCALSVWQMIAHDIFEALTQDGRDTLTRDEVMEVVLDCDRVVVAVERVNRELAGRMRRADARQIELIVREAFPYKEYA